jgi:tetratricopeptide (TPR) repeat protein
VQELQPLGALRFAQKGLAGYSIEFVRDPAGNVVALMSHQPNGVFFASRIAAPGQGTQAGGRPPAGPSVPPAAAGRASTPAVSSQPSAAPPAVRNPQPTSTTASLPAPVAPQRPQAARAAAAQPASAAASAPAASATNAATSAAAASSAASCDALAAHPDDDGKPADVAGAADEVIVATRAIPACTQAVQLFPKDGRLHFQLGRAYWAAKRHGDAIDSFLKAEELKYAPAYFYLAEAYDYGLVEGEKADANLATALYGLAAEGGFLPAKAMLGLDTGGPALAFDPDAFTRPVWIRALHDGDIKALNDRAGRSAMITYLAGMHDLLVDNLKEYGPDCASRIDARFSNVLNAMEEAELIVMENLGAPIPDKAVTKTRQAGVDDMDLLVSDYGGCSSEAFARIYATLKSYVTGGEPAHAANVAPADERRLVDSCIRQEDYLRKTLAVRHRSPEESAQFCQCVAPRIAASPLPPLDRNAFADNWSYARQRLSGEAYNKIMGPIIAACTK